MDIWEPSRRHAENLFHSVFLAKGSQTHCVSRVQLCLGQVQGAVRRRTSCSQTEHDLETPLFLVNDFRREHELSILVGAG